MPAAAQYLSKVMTPAGRRWSTAVTAVVLAVLTIALIGFAAGPRVRLSLRVPHPELPGTLAELSAAVTARESAVSRIIPAAAGEIVFAEPDAPRRTEYAVVYLHGFSASRREISPVPEQIAQRLGANLYLARLTGHGTDDPEALGNARPDDWLFDAVEALEIGSALGNKLIIVATSTGATLSTILADRFPGRIHALVSVSPNYGPRDRMSWLTLAPWGYRIAEAALGEFVEWTPLSEDHATFWTTRYRPAAIVNMMALVDAGWSISHNEISVPILIFYSERDRTVESWRIEEVFERWGSAAKRLVAVGDSTDSGQHVITGNIRSPNTTDRFVATTLHFISSLNGQADE